jgi:glycosyltransferase involved in cell wall biosynthesis
MSFLSKSGSIRRMAMVGSHTPRQCGIATFTADLRAALAARAPGLDCLVAAVTDPGQHYPYPAWVGLEIDQDDPASYRRAAEALDGLGLDVLSVQHEYGIYGGRAGAHLLDLLQRVRVPVVTTLHTILAQPDPLQWTVMDGILRHSARIVVMSSHGAAILRRVHGLPARRIDLIHHGIPPVPFHGGTKERLGLDGRRVILTFGLLAPDKGIETVIEAMPAILQAFPDTVYVVLGGTHPHVRARHGESYRTMLEQRARALGVADRVVFHNRFVPLAELTEFLAAADLYVTPYLKMEQITSGTLAYALGAGRAIISTPYQYARELLADGRGALVPRGDPDALARTAVDLLGDDAKRMAMRRKAAEFGRTMAWPVVAGGYLQTFQKAIRERAARPAPDAGPWKVAQLPLEQS